MKPLFRAIGFTGAGALGLAALSFASPASAVTVAGCGDEPDNGVLVNNSGVCELDFALSGTFTWAVPAGITSLYGVLVGGGGGALTNGSSEGYAGSGGQVSYFDYSSVVAGTVAVISVGHGGASGVTALINQDGNPTTVQFGMMGTPTTANGGASSAFGPNFCSTGLTTSVYVGPGDGAGGTAVNAMGEDCVGAYGPSVNPSTDADSASVPALPIFSSLDMELGAGGDVVIAPDALADWSDLDGAGHGASVLVASDLATVPSADPSGGGGRVIFRYTTETSDGAGAGGGSESESGAGTDAALAKTGTDVLAPIALLSALGIVGVGFLALARRRRAAASSTKR
jgi:hypothetical protein